MATTTTAGLYMLADPHAAAIQRFLTNPAAATMLGVSDATPPSAGADAVARTAAERTTGASYWNAVVDRGDVKGIVGLIGPYSPAPEIRVWIDPAARRRGYGRLATRMILDFAFRNRQAPRVHAFAPVGDPAAERTLATFGFGPAPGESTPAPNTVHVSLSRPDWIAHRDRAALAKLHPALRAILDAELAAGNEVAETGGGWPDEDSIFVRLRDPFRTTPSPLPAGVTYTEPNDPHWWKADYSSQSPRHILAC